MIRPVYRLLSPLAFVVFGPVLACGAPDDAGENDPCPPCAAWPDEWSAVEQDMLGAVNAVRATGFECPNGYRAATQPVAIADALQTASRRHAYDMATNAYFSHTSQDGRSPWERIDAAKYDGESRAENIAAGQGDAAGTLEQWLTSGGHCDNLMRSDVNAMGVGYAFDEDAPYQHYWVQTFGQD